MRAWAALLCIPMLLTGCIKGLFPDPEADAKRFEDEAAATGAGCRQSGRSLEQCYQRNDGLNRNGALRGWREMDEYMRQNKLSPQLPTKDDQDKDAGLKDASKGDSDSAAADSAGASSAQAASQEAAPDATSKAAVKP